MGPPHRDWTLVTSPSLDRIFFVSQLPSDSPVERDLNPKVTFSSSVVSVFFPLLPRGPL